MSLLALLMAAIEQKTALAGGGVVVGGGAVGGVAIHRHAVSARDQIVKTLIANGRELIELGGHGKKAFDEMITARVASRAARPLTPKQATFAADLSKTHGLSPTASNALATRALSAAQFDKLLRESMRKSVQTVPPKSP